MNGGQRMQIRYCPTDSYFQRELPLGGYDSLLRGLEERILYGAPYAVFQYLALRTEYTANEWFRSSAKFEDKRRLSWYLMQGLATHSLIQHTFEGGIVYPCAAMEEIFQ